jgi:hypothetical protein
MVIYLTEVFLSVFRSFKEFSGSVFAVALIPRRRIAFGERNRRVRLGGGT